MSNMQFDNLLMAIKQHQTRVQEFILEHVAPQEYLHPHLHDAVLSYLRAGGKSLRPAVLIFCCQAVGGDADEALPAAAAIELYHNFTLVHDDIIDNDDLRRGKPTVHAEFRERAKQELGYDATNAAHYGLSMAILAGDIQHGWASAAISLLSRLYDVPPRVALTLNWELFHRVQNLLIEGEALDVLYSRMPVEQLTPDKILDMFWKKTGVLYEFAGFAGACIGLGTAEDPTIQHLANFTSKCGIGFQVQDDILGIMADEAKLGKPVGSDIREGKRTLILLGSLPYMTDQQREFALSILGKAEASQADIDAVIAILKETGGVDYAQRLAQTYIDEAMSSLDHLPHSEAKQHLQAWADYMLKRQF